MFAFVSIYIYLNIVILGLISGEKAVGFFTSGTKILNIINVLITSLGAVMLPRCSNLIETKEETKFNGIITKSYHFILAVSIPMMVFILFLSKPIILVLCGIKFYESILVVRITAPTIIFVALSNVIGMQILFPMNKEKIVIFSTFIAAIINIIVNLILIPHFSQNGAAIATLLSEFSIIIFEMLLGKKYIPFKLIDKNVGNYLKGSLLMLLALCLIYFFLLNIYITLILSTLIGFLSYFGYLLYTKDEIAIEILKYIKNKE
jgi:O-antigen/teichoic acid export membrane protein